MASSQRSMETTTYITTGEVKRGIRGLRQKYRERGNSLKTCGCEIREGLLSEELARGLVLAEGSAPS